MNVPVKLSLFRILSAFVFLFFSAYEALYCRIIALIVFVIAAITDYYDGKIAREKKQVTDIGKFLDPLADKILVSAAFISFVGYSEFRIPSWLIVIIISREFIITGLRNLLQTKNISMPADFLGKFKTTTQLTVIIIILVLRVFEFYLESIKYYNDILFLPKILIYITAFITLYSGLNYFIQYKQMIEKEFE